MDQYDNRKFSPLIYLDDIYSLEHLKCSSYSTNCEIIMALPYTNSLMDFNYFVYQKLVHR